MSPARARSPHGRLSPMPVKVEIGLDREAADILTPVGYNKAATRAMRKAGISGQRAMRAEATRRVRAMKNIRAKDVRKVMTKDRTNSPRIEGLSWRIELDGKPVSLMAYRPRQIRRGVSVAVNKGKRTVIRGAFIAVMPKKKGKKAEGDQESGGKIVAIRRGRKRLPIDKLLGSRPVDALLKSGESEAVAARGAEVAVKAFVRLWPAEVAKVNK